jgi:hypothetical protein
MGDPIAGRAELIFFVAALLLTLWLGFDTPRAMRLLLSYDRRAFSEAEWGVRFIRFGARFVAWGLSVFLVAHFLVAR